MFTPDPLVESWRDLRRTSRHLELELAATNRHGRPLDANKPVAGCDCPTCATYLVGGSDEDAAIAELIVERLKRYEPSERKQRFGCAYAEWRELSAVLPPARRLWALCNPEPGRRRVPPDPLPIEAARSLSILEVCERLGLGEPQRRGGEWFVSCPFHDDGHPSLRMNAASNLWYCDPCATGGDSIDLWERVRGVAFAGAVREMAVA